jgi:ligand-binding sensor domain-containing protein
VSKLEEDERWQTFDLVGGLASEPPAQLAVDPFGLLWVAYRTLGPGLTVLNPDTGQWVNRPCVSWDIPAEYARARYAGVQTLTLTAEGSAWVGMHDGLFYARREQNQFVCQLVPEVAGSPTAATQLAPAGSAYVLAGGQVWQGQAGQLTAAEFTLTQTVQSMAVVPEGSVWLVSGGDLILQSAYNQKRIPLPAGVGQVHELLVLGPEVWLATSAGVWVVESGRWRTLTPAEGLPSTQVWVVRYTEPSEWWFQTAGGLARYRP